MICPVCGEPVEIGAWPWCPHDPIIDLAIISDDIEGGPRYFETMGHDAPFIDSKSAWRREVAARNLEHVDRHDGAYYAKRRRLHEERMQDERA